MLCSFSMDQKYGFSLNYNIRTMIFHRETIQRYFNLIISLRNIKIYLGLGCGRENSHSKWVILKPYVSKV